MRTVLDWIRWRRSVRGFQDHPVEEEVLREILEAGRWAPSSNNTQPWHFVVVRDRNLISRIARAVPIGPKRVNAWIAGAPAVIAACGRPALFSHRLGQMIDKDYHRIDVAIAVSYMVLEATEMGVGTCIVGWFHRRQVGKILAIPRRMEVVLLVILGYPAEGGHPKEGIGGLPPRPRRPLKASVSLEQYGKPFWD